MLKVIARTADTVRDFYIQRRITSSAIPDYKKVYEISTECRQYYVAISASLVPAKVLIIEYMEPVVDQPDDRLQLTPAQVMQLMEPYMSQSCDALSSRKAPGAKTLVRKLHANPTGVHWSEVYQAMGKPGKFRPNEQYKKIVTTFNQQFAKSNLHHQFADGDFLWAGAWANAKPPYEADPLIILVWQKSSRENAIGPTSPFNSATIIDSASPSSSAQAVDHRVSASPVTLSPRLKQRLDELDIDATVRASIGEVLAHPSYPSFMSVEGHLSKNPLWRKIDISERERLIKEYPLDRLSGPRVMHNDLLLMRCNDVGGCGKLYNYFSTKWGYLIPFRERKPGDSPSERISLNTQHLAAFLSGPPNDFSITPLPGRFIVSLKRHADTQDLMLYIFECCSVVYQGKSAAQAFKERSHGGDPTPSQWFSMQQLRANERSMATNEDVIWSINEMFTVTLKDLPLSVSTGFICT